MTEKELARHALRAAHTRVEALRYISQRERDLFYELINLILNVPDETQQSRDEFAGQSETSELSSRMIFDEYLTLPDTPGDCTTRMQFLLQELETALHQMEWLNFLRLNDLADERD